MDDIVILCLSDLHIGSDNYYKTTEDKFLVGLKNLPWNPDFLCITGDIVDRGRWNYFNEAEEFIKKMWEPNIGKMWRDYVLMAAGNHDMDIKDIDITDKDKDNIPYFKSLDLFFENITDNKNEYEKSIKPHFLNYINFRNKFTTSIKNDENYPESLEFLRPLVQYKIFEKEKVIFWELNNTWYSIPDCEKEMRFGAGIIEKFHHRIDELKKEGYFVVTLFHQPFRRIASNEYRIYKNTPCICDEIVKLSDICLAGHEHGMGKAADFLGNSCQYISNGIFNPKADKDPQYNSSALLLKINRLSNTISRKELIFENGEKYVIKNRDEIDDPVFHIYPDYLSKEAFKKRHTRISDTNFYRRELPYNHYNKNPELLYRKIVSTVFGEKFDFDFKENKLMCDGNSEASASLYFEHLDVEKTKSQINLTTVTNGKTFVFYLAPAGMPSDFAEIIAKRYNEPYNKNIINGDLITFVISLL